MSLYARAISYGAQAFDELEVRDRQLLNQKAETLQWSLMAEDKDLEIMYLNNAKSQMRVAYEAEVAKEISWRDLSFGKKIGNISVGVGFGFACYALGNAVAR